MIEAQLSAFDACVLGILAISTLVSFFRGFVKEVLSLGAWVGAGLVTIYYFPDVAQWLKPKFKNEMVATGFGTLGTYICALLLFSMINSIILKFLKSGSDVGVLDNTLGLMFGLFRGAFIISLGMLMLMMVWDPDNYPTWLKEAKTRPYAEKGAVILAKVAPGYLRDVNNLKDRLKGASPEEEKDFKDDSMEKARVTRGDSKENSSDTPGYGEMSRQQLDKLLNGAGK